MASHQIIGYNPADIDHPVGTVTTRVFLDDGSTFDLVLDRPHEPTIDELVDAVVVAKMAEIVETPPDPADETVVPVAGVDSIPDTVTDDTADLQAIADAKAILGDPTTTSLSTKENPANAGSVDLTATVESKSKDTPTGVVFLYDVNAKMQLIAKAELAGNTATFTQDVVDGKYDYVAAYQGDVLHAPSSSDEFVLAVGKSDVVDVVVTP